MTCLIRRRATLPTASATEATIGSGKIAFVRKNRVGSGTNTAVIARMRPRSGFSEPESAREGVVSGPDCFRGALGGRI